MSDSIQFDPKTHTYRYKGKPVPSVTTVLKNAGLINYNFHSSEKQEFYLKRGRFVHAAISQKHFKVFDDEVHDRYPIFSPYIRGYERFEEEHEFKSHVSELMLFDEELWLAGTMDLAGFRGRAFLGEVEIKTGHAQRWAQLQSAAYRMLYNRYAAARDLDPIQGEHVLELHNDGTYKLIDPRDSFEERWLEFAECLDRYHEETDYEDNGEFYSNPLQGE